MAGQTLYEEVALPDLIGLHKGGHNTPERPSMLSKINLEDLTNLTSLKSEWLTNGIILAAPPEYLNNWPGPRTGLEPTEMLP